MARLVRLGFPVLFSPPDADSPHSHEAHKQGAADAPCIQHPARPGRGEHAGTKLDAEQCFGQRDCGGQPGEGAQLVEDVGLVAVYEGVVLLGSRQRAQEQQKQPVRVQWVQRRDPQHILQEECIHLSNRTRMRAVNTTAPLVPTEAARRLFAPARQGKQ